MTPWMQLPAVPADHRIRKIVDFNAFHSDFLTFVARDSEKRLTHPGLKSYDWLSNNHRGCSEPRPFSATSSSNASREISHRAANDSSTISVRFTAIKQCSDECAFDDRPHIAFFIGSRFPGNLVRPHSLRFRAESCSGRTDALEVN